MEKVRRKICVFCASNRNTPFEYVEFAGKVGEELARQGFDLVWGGCDLASMGTVARGVQACGGKTIGIIPHYMEEEGLAFKDADELIVVPTLLKRKSLMREISDAFAVLPGGIGTVDEFFSQLEESVTDLKYGRTPQKIAVLNQYHFYTPLENLLEGVYARELAARSCRGLYRICNTRAGVFTYLKE